MKVVIAIDSFKGSMSSIEAGEAAAAGIRKVYSEAKTKVYPLADGGEGTVRALAQGLGGSLENVTVTGPLGAPVVCEYAIWEKRNIGGSGRIDFVGKETDSDDKISAAFGNGVFYDLSNTIGCSVYRIQKFRWNQSDPGCTSHFYNGSLSALFLILVATFTFYYRSIFYYGSIL